MRWRFLRDFCVDFPPLCCVCSGDADKVGGAGLDGPGSGKIKGIAEGGGREGWSGAVGNVIGYSEPGSARGGVSWVSRVAWGIENSSRNVDMGLR